MPNPDTHDALSTIVTRRCNELRKEDLAILLARRPIEAETEPFRERVVCLGIATEAAEDGGVTVLIRGFLPPHALTRHERWTGFVKGADGRWVELTGGATYERLRERIENSLPRA